MIYYYLAWGMLLLRGDIAAEDGMLLGLGVLLRMGYRC